MAEDTLLSLAAPGVLLNGHVWMASVERVFVTIQATAVYFECQRLV